MMTMRTNLRTMICVPVTFLLLGCGEKYGLDKRMTELCRVDGGIKVYETVTLPPWLFDGSGSVKTSTVVKDGKAFTIIADQYLGTEDAMVLKQGDPLKGEGRLTRVNLKIYQIDTGKVLAEGVQYRRAGGDGFYIGHHTQAICPDEPFDLTQRVFAKQKLEEVNKRTKGVRDI